MFKECFQVDYNVDISQSELLTDWYVNYKKESIKAFLNKSDIKPKIDLFNRAFSQNATTEQIRKNLIAVNLYYSRLSYTIISDQPKSDWLMLLASIGGCLGGSFIGLSIVSMTEFLELILRIIGIFAHRSFFYIAKKIYLKMTIVFPLLRKIMRRIYR